MAARYGRYEVLSRLGQGAMAQVFLAKDPVLSRLVAVKVLHAELAARKDVLQRFANEARIVAAIRNPHIVEVFDFGQEGKDLYLVMEFVDGLSLHGLMRRAAAPPAEPALGAPAGVPLYGPLAPSVAAALLCQAAEGLSIAARHGVVHRDLKPENLMINGQGYLKISDFGIAHVQDDSLTQTGAVLGSPLYMSPEQAAGLKPITFQADMFSLGAVFYACLTGRPPFQGRTVTELFRRIAGEPHLPAGSLRPGLDPELGNLIDTLLAKRPSERGGGPAWLHRRLKGYLLASGMPDPAELAASYLQELRARGVQTTWRPDADRIGAPQSAAATERATAPFPESVPGPVPTLPGAVPSARMPAVASSGRAPRSVLGPVILAVSALAVGLGIGGLAARKGAGRTLAAGPDHAASASDAGYPGGPAREPAGTNRPAGSGAGEGNMQVTPSGEAGPLGSGAAAEAEGTGKEPRPRAGASRDSGLSLSADPVRPDSHTEPGPQAHESDAVLILKSSPPFAEAYLDGHFVGMTPVRLAPLASGRHRLMMKPAQGPGLDTSLWVSPGIRALKVRLDAGPGERVAVTPVEDG